MIERQLVQNVLADQSRAEVSPANNLQLSPAVRNEFPLTLNNSALSDKEMIRAAQVRDGDLIWGRPHLADASDVT